MVLPTKILLLVLAGGMPPQGADPYESALVAAVHYFAHRGNLDHLRAILDKHPELVDARETRPPGRKPDATEGYTPLDRAASGGCTAVAEYLIRRGAKVNAVDGRGWTAPHLAARDGHLDVVKLLVEHGADPAAKTDAVPESTGIQPGSPPTAVNDPPKKYPAIPGRTPLDWAVAMNHIQVADYLRSLQK